MKFKKSLAIILILSLSIGLAAGCTQPTEPAQQETPPTTSNNAESSSQASGTAAKEAPLKIRHFYNYDWFDDSYADTQIGQELQKLANVDLEIIISPTADNQMLNLMIASDDLPDMITLEKNDPNIAKMIDNGQLYAFSDLIDQYAPEMRQNSMPEYFQYYNWTDGKQYYFPNFLQTAYELSQPDFNTVGGGTGLSVIRSDVSEAIGNPAMNTPDSFFEAVKAGKAQFPELNGWYFGPFNNDLNFFKASEFHGYLFPATQFGLKVYDEAGGKVTSVIRNPKFLEFIKFMNKMYTNGLLEVESFADARDITEAKIARGNYVAMSGTVLQFSEGSVIQDNPDAKWVPQPYFDGGKYFKDSSGWTATVISKKTADPERLMKFVSFLASPEGRQLIAWGIQGVHWDYVNVDGSEVPRYIGEWDALRMSDWGKFTKEGGFTTYFAFQDDYVHNKPVVKTPSEMSDYEKTVNGYLKPNIEPDIAIGLINPEGTDPEGVIQTKLGELSKSYYPRMVMANSEAEAIAIYEEFVSKADETGLAELENYWTAKYALFG